MLLFAGAGALAAYRGQHERLRAEVVADARRVSDSIDRELAANIDSAEALASLPALDGPLDLIQFLEISRREQARHPLWLSVILLDPEGRRLTNSFSGRLGPARDPASIRPLVEGRRPLIGNIAKGSDAYAIPVRAPVLRDNRVTGIVTVAVRPDGIATALQASRLPPHWITTIVDQSGRVVARSRNVASYLGRPASASALRARATGDQGGTYDGFTLEGVNTISAFWKSPVTGWSVHIGIPRDDFEAPLRRQQVFTIAGFGLSLLLTALFIALLLRELRLRRAEAAATEQSDRMEALGRLTGGVAHDFNNLLMIIQGNAELLQRRVSAETAQRPLAAIREATDRASRLTRELLIFARGGEAESTSLDLNATLSEFLGSIQQAVGPPIELKADLDPDAGWIQVDRVQFELAVLNLAVNARDAMPTGGSLTITVKRATDEVVQLSVADTGQGMTEEVRARVFDPFFTTKPPGVGTGLGLTQVYGFARHAGGTVDLQSRVGRGTTVTLRLPSAAHPVAETVQATLEARPEPEFHGRRILVVDDNPAVRQLTGAYLRERGAEVMECESGAEGLAALGSGRFDAVVCDIVMPGEVDGVALALAARERWPGLTALLVSGYSASLADAGAQGFPVLRKPYALTDLSRLLGDLIQGRGAPSP